MASVHLDPGTAKPAVASCAACTRGCRDSFPTSRRCPVCALNLRPSTFSALVCIASSCAVHPLPGVDCARHRYGKDRSALPVCPREFDALCLKYRGKYTWRHWRSPVRVMEVFIKPAGKSRKLCYVSRRSGDCPANTSGMKSSVQMLQGGATVRSNRSRSSSSSTCFLII